MTVPIRGDASTSDTRSPKTGKVDGPQHLAGTIMSLGKTSGGGMTNISSGAGNEGGGSHKPVLKEDTSRANALEPLDLGYKERHHFTAGFSNGAVTPNSGETFIMSFGPSANEDGVSYPQDPSDPENSGLACPTAEEQIEKYGREYLPICIDDRGPIFNGRCCDVNDLGPCEYHYTLLLLDKEIRYNHYIPRVVSQLEMLILSCIDLTVAYAPGDPIQWLEPAALNLLLPNPEEPDYPDRDHSQDGDRAAYWKDDESGRGYSPFDSGLPINHTANESICWDDLKARTDLDIIVTTPQIDDVEFYWSDGSDIDKVLKQYIKFATEDQTFDHYFGGCAPWWENTDKPAYWQPMMTDSFVSGNDHPDNGTSAKFTLTDWTNTPEDLSPNPNIPFAGKAFHKYWGGERADQWYYLRINSVTKSVFVGVPHTVIKFQWARQNTDMCANLSPGSNPVHIISWSAEQTIDSLLDDYEFAPDWPEPLTDIPQRWWKVEIENNVSIEFALDEMEDSNGYAHPFTGPYFLEVMRYGYFDDWAGHGDFMNAHRCQEPGGSSGSNKCGCPMHKNKQISKQAYIDRVCKCPKRFEGFPEVTNNIVYPDIDSAWEFIREAHGNTIYSNCNCLGSDC